MNEICGDNRFEIIAKAKKHLLDATNIDTSPKEMEVLDGFLFRCWQMGWLDRYDEQTEPKRGEWIRITDGNIPEKYACSVCGRVVDCYESGALLKVRYPYCHCGADMRGEP